MCVLTVPSGPQEPVIGLAGRSARPVSLPRRGRAELVFLRSRAEQIEAILRFIHGRIEWLQAARAQQSVGG